MTPSFWLDQLEPGARRPTLTGPHDADVCIVGGGFTGVWLAYELRRADPSLAVVVLEAETAGFGASGRNGGWVQGDVSGSVEAWRKRGGRDAPVAMARAIRATLPVMGETIEREQIDCDWHQGGSLTVAQSELQLARLHKELEHERAWAGADAALQFLSGAELQARVAVDRGVGALFTEHCARVQPGKLVAGVADAAERAGAAIYEGTRVRERRARHRAGARRAGAGTARDSRDRGLHRQSARASANGAPDEQLDDRDRAVAGGALARAPMGRLPRRCWTAPTCTRTRSARLTAGLRSAAAASRTASGHGPTVRAPCLAQTIRQLRERLRSLFPAVSDVPVARAWHGVLGVSRDWCPTVELNPATGIGFAGGYAGEGVAAAHLAARTMCDLVLGRDTELARLPWVGSPPRNWEPEPLRYIGARSVFHLYGEADRREERTGRTTKLAAVANLIAGR